MKTFKQLMTEVAEPKSADERNFKDKHEIEVTDHPVSKESQHTSSKRKAVRKADYMPGEDEDVYESTINEPVSVDKEKYSWGTLIKIGKGKSHSFPVHPKEQDKIKKIKDGGKITYRDETGTKITVSRNGDTILFDHPGSNDVAEVDRKVFTESKLDPVNKKAATKDFDNRKDKDIDNDGDVDDSDEYLHKRRKAISKAMKKENVRWLDEKATSKAQQKLMGMALAYKNGDLEDASDEVKELADNMSKKDLEDYAKTKHKGLPDKVDESTSVYPKGSKTATSYDSYEDYVAAKKKQGMQVLPKALWTNLKKDSKTESAFVAKAAYAKKNNKKKFELGDEEYPVTIKDKNAEKIVNEAKKIIKDLGLNTKIVRDKDGSLSIHYKDKNIGDQQILLTPRQVKELHGLLMNEDLGHLMNEYSQLEEAFKKGSMELDDGSTVDLSKQDAELLNQMFDDLNPTNRKKMKKVAMEDEDGFEEILGFAREAL